jgi:uncharacterized protein YjbJ (UPF0337 family)
MKDDTQPANSAARDKAVGSMTHAKGRLKEGLGELTGNERLKAEGQSDQVAGKARVRKGQWKERIKAWIDRR